MAGGVGQTNCKNYWQEKNRKMACDGHASPLAMGGTCGTQNGDPESCGSHDAHKTPGRGRPPAHWAQMLIYLSIKELRGNADAWEALAQDRAEWNHFTTIFIEFVETHVLRADTRATLARDAVSVREANQAAQEGRGPAGRGLEQNSNAGGVLPRSSGARQ